MVSSAPMTAPRSVAKAWSLSVLLLGACVQSPEPAAPPPEGESDAMYEAGGTDGLRKVNGGTNGDPDYCNGSSCNDGEGDCDTNAECAGGNICIADNGGRFRVSPAGPFINSTYDVCAPSH